MLARIPAAAGAVLAATAFSGAVLAQDPIRIGVTQPMTGAFAASENGGTSGSDAE